ncbi:MAG: DUF2924 domain-containing protein [Phycisphaeraceae bacterium]|nr:DUF2924 domain-containing protein [Phycisphaeraceae bacterium]
MSELRRMTVGELRREYAEVFGEPTRTNHKQYLVKRIVWRLSADGERGVTRGACRRCGRVESVKEYAGGGRAGDEWPEWFVSV